MTINTTACHVTQIGNGVTTAWNFDFVAGQANWLVVTLTNVSTGAVTTLNPIQYTVVLNTPPVGGLWSIGGVVNYPLIGSPLTSGYTITIGRYTPVTQNISIANQGAFYPQAVEQALDILELQIQDIYCELGALTQLIQDLTLNAFIWAYVYFASGTTTNAETFTIVNIPQSMSLPVSLNGSIFTCGVNPTANTTLTIKKNSTVIGTVVFHTNGTNTVTFASAVDFVAGDQFVVLNQASADATLANISLTFVFNNLV